MFLGGPDGLPASRPAGIDALLVFPVVAVVVPVLSMISLSFLPSRMPFRRFPVTHFPNGIAKVLLFSLLPNFFALFFLLFPRSLRLRDGSDARKPLDRTRL